MAKLGLGILCLFWFLSLFLTTCGYGYEDVHAEGVDTKAVMGSEEGNGPRYLDAACIPTATLTEACVSRQGDDASNEEGVGLSAVLVHHMHASGVDFWASYQDPAREESTFSSNPKITVTYSSSSTKSRGSSPTSSPTSHPDPAFIIIKTITRALTVAPATHNQGFKTQTFHKKPIRTAHTHNRTSTVNGGDPGATREAARGSVYREMQIRRMVVAGSLIGGVMGLMLLGLAAALFWGWLWGSREGKDQGEEG